METQVQLQVPSTTPFLGLCPICDKAFTREYSYDRHVSYCKRAQTKRKGRPKSCVSCNTSKTKCSFTKPRCSRCDAKGLLCVYDRSGQQGWPSNPPAVQSADIHLLESGQLDLDGDVSVLDDTLPNLASSWQRTDVSGISGPLYEYNLPQPTASTASFALNPVYRFTASRDDWDRSSSGAVARNSINNSNIQLPSPSDENERISNDINHRVGTLHTLLHLRQGNPASRHAASLISHIISAFPQMMLRRNTFPPFIHAYWHSPAVPEIIANCMSVSQLYVARTPETRPFLWRTIEAEHREFRDKLYFYSPAEIQQAVQAISIYIIMAIIDQDEDTSTRGASLMKTFIGLKARLHEIHGGEMASETEKQSPSATWEDWVFAESRRRIGCLWFVIRHVFSVDPNKDACKGFDDFANLALMCSKTAWEARTRDEWETEKAFHDVSRPVTTFGELVAARRNPRDPLNAQRLDTWEAGADKLALLMNIAVELAGDSL